MNYCYGKTEKCISIEDKGLEFSLYSFLNVSLQVWPRFQEHLKMWFLEGPFFSDLLEKWKNPIAKCRCPKYFESSGKESIRSYKHSSFYYQSGVFLKKFLHDEYSNVSIHRNNSESSAYHSSTACINWHC